MAYLANGLVDTTTSLSPAAQGTVVTNPDYATSAVNPAIFATSVVVNDVGTVTDPATQHLTTTTQYDGWGRPLVVTDPDGVSMTSHYKASGTGAMTDIDTVTDGLGNYTTTTYDAVGNALSVTSSPPLSEVTSTTYDLLNHPLRITEPDSTVTAYEYDLAGQQTAVIANYVDGTPSSGIDDVRTTSQYDEYGRVLRTDSDDTQVDAVTKSTYDLVGNVLTSTAYPGADGTGTARTTTNDYPPVTNGLSRAEPTGVRLPIVPTSGGPACPSGIGMCNTVTALDFNGQPIATTDAYNQTTASLLDLGGRPVRTIVNYVDGVNTGSEADTDLITTTTYKVTGQPEFGHRALHGGRPPGVADVDHDLRCRRPEHRRDRTVGRLHQEPLHRGQPRRAHLRGGRPRHRRRGPQLDALGLRQGRPPDQDDRPLRPER